MDLLIFDRFAFKKSLILVNFFSVVKANTTSLKFFSNTRKNFVSLLLSLKKFVLEALKLTEEREQLHRSSLRQVAIGEVLSYIAQTGLSKNDLAEVLEKSTRTLDNLQGKGGKLSIRETETYIKLKEMMDLGIKIFGSPGFVKWLEKENPFSKDLKPKSFLKTDSGIDLIKEQLLKLVYGYVA